MPFHVMQLEMVPWIGRRGHSMMPTARGASEVIAGKNFNTHIVLDCTVMRRQLPIGLKHVNPDWQIRPAGLPGRHHPALLDTQLSQPPCPISDAGNHA
jgi:hypothetical protein